jgi:hypothetical protein
LKKKKELAFTAKEVEQVVRELLSELPSSGWESVTNVNDLCPQTGSFLVRRESPQRLF